VAEPTVKRQAFKYAMAARGRAVVESPPPASRMPAHPEAEAGAAEWKAVQDLYDRFGGSAPSTSGESRELEDGPDLQEIEDFVG
jgi:hypothetical protein